MNNIAQNLMSSLYRLIGNKVYMRTIEAKIKTLDLTPEEKQAFEYLIRDLNHIQAEKQNLQNRVRTGRFF
jgi:hypothetical protein